MDLVWNELALIHRMCHPEFVDWVSSWTKISPTKVLPVLRKIISIILKRNLLNAKLVGMLALEKSCICNKGP
jgi:hypothetical protein